jgi:hypothetical protein
MNEIDVHSHNSWMSMIREFKIPSQNSKVPFGISISQILEESKVRKIEKIAGIIRHTNIQSGILQIADSSGEIQVILHRKNAFFSSISL